MLPFIGVCQDKGYIVGRNLYEFGEPLTTCEANFRNLFNNWNGTNITNIEDYSLINFAFVETIKDSSAIEFYSKLLTDDKSLAGSVKKGSYSSFKDNISTKRFEQFFSFVTFASLTKITDSTPPAEISRRLKGLEQERKLMRYGLKHLISAGDKVYVIFFKDKQQIYTTFVICSGKTNEVIYDVVFSNLKYNNEVRKVR